MPENIRKVVHLSALTIPILSELTSKSMVLGALVTITIVYALEEVLRLKSQPLPIITTFTLKMSRPDERASFIIRPIYLATGIIVALALYSSTIAYSSILICAIGDPIAAVVGRKSGRIRISKRKTLEGSAAGWVVSFLVASFFISPFIALVGATGGMFMELVDVPDDNLTMPIVAGAMMTLATLVLH